MPKISIISAVYNVEEYLTRWFDSLMNQTLKDIEIICVNDGSTDNSLKILNQYAQNDNRIKVISQENQGAGVARNNAINLATGEYVMIVDPDDWLELDACEVCYNQIVQNQNDFVTFNALKYFEENGKTELYDYRVKPFKNIIANSNIKINELNNDFIKTPYTCMQIYSREFLVRNQIKYTGEKLGEDLYFWLNVIINADNFSIIERPIYNYRIRIGSATQDYKNLWQDLFSCRYRCMDLLDECKVGENYKNAFAYYNIHSLLFWLNKLIKERKLTKDFYNELRKIFLYIEQNYDLKTAEKYVDYKKYKQICKTTWFNYCLIEILKICFSITKTKTQKVVTIFGIKIKIKRGK